VLKWIFVAALAAAVAGPAFAQKTDLPDRPLKQTTPFSDAPIKEGIAAVKQSGECTITYIVGVDGKPKDIKPQCTIPGMDPYAVRFIETGVWDSEITGGEFFDSYPQKQIFKFGATSSAAADPRGEKAPVVVKDIEPAAVSAALSRARNGAKCNVTLTVGADGKPKNISPNCTPSDVNSRIAEAVKKMTFQPGLKGGQPVEWPNLTIPMSFAPPN